MQVAAISWLGGCGWFTHENHLFNNRAVRMGIFFCFFKFGIWFAEFWEWEILLVSVKREGFGNFHENFVLEWWSKLPWRNLMWTHTMQNLVGEPLQDKNIYSAKCNPRQNIADLGQFNWKSMNGSGRDSFTIHTSPTKRTMSRKNFQKTKKTSNNEVSQRGCCFSMPNQWHQEKVLHFTILRYWTRPKPEASQRNARSWNPDPLEGSMVKPRERWTLKIGGRMVECTASCP